jgi:hypothetical protein
MKINEIITESSRGSIADQLAPIQQQRMADYERDFKANNMTPAQRQAQAQAEKMKAVTSVQSDEYGFRSPGLSKRKANLDTAIKKFETIKNACNFAEERGLNVREIRSDMNDVYTQYFSDNGHRDDYTGLNEYLDKRIAMLKTIFARARMLKKNGEIKG